MSCKIIDSFECLTWGNITVGIAILMLLTVAGFFMYLFFKEWW